MRRKKKSNKPTINVPSRLKVGDEEYRILWCSDLREGLYGLCTMGEPRVIVLNSKQDKEELLPTLCHEWAHAVEHELKIKLGHKVINKLEYALAQFIAQLIR